MEPKKTRRRASRRGLTLIELMVVSFIMLIIMVGIAGLLNASWQSYTDLTWQNRVDTEARKALDAMTDSIRVSGWQGDYFDTVRSRNSTADTNIDPASTQNLISLTAGNAELYATSQIKSSKTDYLESNAAYGTPKNQVAAYYIKHDNDSTKDGIQFRYEYRTATSANAQNTDWTFTNTATPDDPSTPVDPVSGIGEPYFITRTVYITVTASHDPYPNSIDSRTYSRTLTGAVTLRAPYNAPVPPSKANGP